MEENPLSAAQVFLITNIEVLISGFSDNPENYFNTIIALIDANNIAEHKDIIKYIYELLERKGYAGYAAEFAKKYNIKPGNP
jgi:hypothetical protein